MKKLMVIFALVWMIFLMSGCASVETVDESEDISMFVVIERTGYWNIVYQKDTRVMYAVSDGSYNHGTFTLLVNPDGTPMIWEE